MSLLKNHWKLIRCTLMSHNVYSRAQTSLEVNVARVHVEQTLKFPWNLLCCDRFAPTIDFIFLRVSPPTVQIEFSEVAFLSIWTFSLLRYRAFQNARLSPFKSPLKLPKLISTIIPHNFSTVPTWSSRSAPHPSTLESAKMIILFILDTRSSRERRNGAPLFARPTRDGRCNSWWPSAALVDRRSRNTHRVATTNARIGYNIAAVSNDTTRPCRISD